MQSCEWRCTQHFQFYAQQAREAKPQFSVYGIENGQWIRHLSHKSILGGWFLGVELRQQFFRMLPQLQRFCNRLVFKGSMQSIALDCCVDGVFVIAKSVTCNQTTRSSIFRFHRGGTFRDWRVCFRLEMRICLKLIQN